MEKTLFCAITLFLACCLFSCFNTKENSSPLQGKYLGSVPAADCPGIDIELIFTANKYTLAYAYQDRQGIFISSGSFKSDGEKIKLLGDGARGAFENYLIQNDKLILLSPSGEVPADTRAYTLSKSDLKVSMTQIVNKYWKLVELNGKPVNYAENSKIDTTARMTLKPDGMLNGNASCNTFSGAFTFHGSGRIRFSRIAITQKMCLDMSVETEFMNVLQKADSYIIDGERLILNRARMAPLARFEAVYM